MNKTGHSHMCVNWLIFGLRNYLSDEFNGICLFHCTKVCRNFSSLNFLFFLLSLSCHWGINYFFHINARTFMETVGTLEVIYQNNDYHFFQSPNNPKFPFFVQKVWPEIALWVLRIAFSFFHFFQFSHQKRNGNTLELMKI